LRGFYSTLKSLSKYLRFIFITGITNLPVRSIFSGMNHYNDISLDKKYNQLLGYTQQEIVDNFTPHIKAFAQTKHRTEKQILAQMRDWYNGYRFSELPTKVYNPVSVLYYLHDQKRKNYWINTGTPYSLIKFLKSNHKSLETARTLEETQNKYELSEEALKSLDLDNIDLTILLFQSGYLTISDYNEETNQYRLAFPNREVRDSFNKYLLTVLANSSIPELDKTISFAKQALQKNDMKSFGKQIQILFSSIPYQLHIKKEAYYHSLLHLFIRLLGYKPQSEVSTSNGRIDMTFKTLQRRYVLELKFKHPTQTAITQIHKQRQL